MLPHPHTNAVLVTVIGNSTLTRRTCFPTIVLWYWYNSCDWFIQHSKCQKMQNVSVASEFRLTVGLKRKSVVSEKVINATQLRRQKCLKRPPMSGCPGLTRTTLYKSCKSLWVAFWQYRTRKATRKYEATLFSTSFTTWPVARFDTYLETRQADTTHLHGPRCVC